MQRLHAQLISHAEPGFDKSQKQMAAFRKQRSAGAAAHGRRGADWKAKPPEKR
jgi:hypothetical protein